MNHGQQTLARISRTEGRGLLGSLLLTLPFMLVLGAGLLLLAAYIVFRRDDPSAAVTLGGYAALGGTAWLSGLVAGKLYRRRGWLAGGLTGGLLLLALAILSAITGEGSSLSLGVTLGLYGGVLLLSLFGGLLGGARRVKSKKRRRSH